LLAADSQASLTASAAVPSTSASSPSSATAPPGFWTIAAAKFPQAIQIVDLYHAPEHLRDLSRLRGADAITTPRCQRTCRPEDRIWPAARNQTLAA
jgi:hypothetical protein